MSKFKIRKRINQNSDCIRTTERIQDVNKLSDLTASPSQPELLACWTQTDVCHPQVPPAELVNLITGELKKRNVHRDGAVGTSWVFNALDEGNVAAWNKERWIDFQHCVCVTFTTSILWNLNFECGDLLMGGTLPSLTPPVGPRIFCIRPSSFSFAPSGDAESANTIQECFTYCQIPSPQGLSSRQLMFQSLFPYLHFPVRLLHHCTNQYPRVPQS